MRLTISSIFILATAAVVASKEISLNPPVDSFKPNPITSPADTAKPIEERTTNAKRLATILPPPKPDVLERDNTADSAHNAGHSPSRPCPLECNILVKNATHTFGYVSPVWNVFGEYGIVQKKQAGSLKVKFSASPGPSSHELNLRAENGPSASYPYFGATLGFVSPSNDLSAGSYSYAYITGTTKIPRGPAAPGDNNSFGGTTGIPESAESAIWKYNPTTKRIRPQWINTDGSRPRTHLVYANDFNQAFILTGDVAVFQSTFGAPYPPITFTCVPPKHHRD